MTPSYATDCVTMTYPPFSTRLSVLLLSAPILFGAACSADSAGGGTGRSQVTAADGTTRTGVLQDDGSIIQDDGTIIQADGSRALFDCSGPIKCSSRLGSFSFNAIQWRCASCTWFSPNIL